MSARLTALVVWALVAGAAMFWGWRLWAARVPVPAQALVASAEGALVGDLNRLLGAPPVAPVAAVVAPDVASRFQLTGVVATPSSRAFSGAGSAGIALISVDGKPPRAFRVGDALDANLVLQSVALRSARIAPGAGGEGFVLNLPPPPVAATGVPAALVAGGDTASAGAAMAGAPVAYGAGSADLQPVGVGPGLMASQAAAQAALAAAQAQAAAQAAAMQQSLNAPNEARLREQRQ